MDIMLIIDTKKQFLGEYFRKSKGITNEQIEKITEKISLII